MKQYILNYSDFLNEANRGNYYPNSKEEFYKFINKYKGQEDLIFISFKSSDKFVSKINLGVLDYSTPTGIYTYPYKNYVENLIDDGSILSFDLPYLSTSDFLYVYKLKSLERFLTFQNKEDYRRAEEILYEFKSNFLSGVYDEEYREFHYKNNLRNIQDYNEDEDEDDIGYPNKITMEMYRYDWDEFIINLKKSTRFMFDLKNPICILYNFVHNFLSFGNLRKTTNIFREYRVDGFVDNNGASFNGIKYVSGNGNGFIHTNEKIQAVIFDISEIEDYIIIDRTRDSKYKFKNFTNEEKRRINNPKNINDLKLISDFLDLDFSKMSIDSDGLWSYSGTINIIGKNLKEIPSYFNNLKSVGELSFKYIEKIKDITNFKNLRFVGTLNFEGFDPPLDGFSKDLEVQKITPQYMMDKFKKYKNL